MTAGPETSREATRPIVVFAIDEGYAMPLAVTLRSILEASANADFDFRVLHTGISPATRARVQASLPRGGATLTWQEADLGAFSGCGTLPHITGVTYARLLLDRLLPDAKRAIYLDADTLVLTDLRRLWSTPLRGAPVGAVVDGVSPALRANEGALPGRPEVPRYFNAGVLLIDLERWRAAGVSAAATDYILRHPNSPYSDQDALNIALDGAWAELDCRWNCQAHLHFHDLKSYPETERPFILHFVTSGKPWNFLVPNANAKVYDLVRDRTAYARTLRDRCRDGFRRGGAHVRTACQGSREGLILYGLLKKILRHRLRA
jgi:lipopolysaccharide biosynthesis glycosyltransferase